MDSKTDSSLLDSHKLGAYAHDALDDSPWAIETQSSQQPATFAGGLRFGAANVLHILADIVVSRGSPTPLPQSLPVLDKQRLNNHARLLGGLEIAHVDGGTVTPARRTTELIERWIANDLDGLAYLFLPYGPFATIVANPSTDEVGREARSCVRGLAAYFGQVAKFDDMWYDGAARPTYGQVRAAVLAHIRRRPETRAVTMYQFLIDIMLKELHVAPPRVVKAWPRLVGAGVFEGLEFRRGGSSTGLRVEFGEFFFDGWRQTSVDVETVDGYRDMVARPEVT